MEIGTQKNGGNSSKQPASIFIFVLVPVMSVSAVTVK